MAFHEPGRARELPELLAGIGGEIRLGRRPVGGGEEARRHRSPGRTGYARNPVAVQARLELPEQLFVDRGVVPEDGPEGIGAQRLECAGFVRRRQPGLPCPFIESRQQGGPGADVKRPRRLIFQDRKPDPLWIGPSSGMANPVRCDASWRVSSSAGEWMPIRARSCRGHSRSKPFGRPPGWSRQGRSIPAGRCRRPAVPDFHAGEDRTEGPQHQRHDPVVHFVNVEPLRHDAAGFQPAGAQFIVLRLKTLPTPAIQGFEGSVMITSYSCGLSLSTVRASSHPDPRPRVRRARRGSSRRRTAPPACTGSQFSATVRCSTG